MSSVQPFVPIQRQLPFWARDSRQACLQLLLIALLIPLGLLAQIRWLSLTAALLLGCDALLLLLPSLWRQLLRSFEEPRTVRILALLALPLALLGMALSLGWLDGYLNHWRQGNWEAISAIGEGLVGAFGQILVALVALTIAWQQVRVDQRLSGQQNRITQAQTIDSFIQGLTDLILDEQGLLEDWPLERRLAEGRLAAVLASVDAEGKARILRFLSQALLLTPLRRDHRLGRAILDGRGSYEVDRLEGVPVIRLTTMLRGADLSGTDLRGVDFHDADLRGTDFTAADLSETNLAGCDLGGAILDRSLLEGARFFQGRPQTATPIQTGSQRDLDTGSGTGAIVAEISLRGARRLDAQQHYYLASWGGSRTRACLPGGCRGIADQLEQHPG